MGGRKDTKQEKNEGSGGILDMVERLYGRRRYLGEERKFEKCRRIKEFERGGVEIRRQEGEGDEYRRMELPGKYTAKLLYGWDNKEFEEEYLRKLEKNWRK